MRKGKGANAVWRVRGAVVASVGIIDRDGRGPKSGVVFPYDGVRVEFTLGLAA